MYQSVIQSGGFVKFPEFKGEQHYMIPFMQKEGLPRHLSHWQNTVDQMLDGIKSDQPIYIMIDQKEVGQGQTHRRPGVHIDGYWVPDLFAHGNGGHRGGGWGHGGRPVHRPFGRHSCGGRYQGGHTIGWDNPDFSYPEALILASSHTGAVAYVGDYEGVIGEGGDCSDIDIRNLEPVQLRAGVSYIGTVSTLHESIPMYGAKRTLVRLNCPGVSVH